MLNIYAAVSGKVSLMQLHVAVSVPKIYTEP